MFHRSERLFLRPAFQEDCGAILAGIGDESIVRNLARAPWPYTSDDARSFAALPQNPRLPHFLVTLPGAGVIGAAGLGTQDGDRVTELGAEPEIGYWIAREHWGRGYATEAARAVLRIAHTLGHRRIVAGHFVDNPASGKVLCKIGFLPTGHIAKRHSHARGAWVDSVEYALDSDAQTDPAPVARAA